MEKPLIKIGRTAYWSLYVISILYMLLGFSSCTKDESKKCYTCISATKYHKLTEVLQVKRDTVALCDVSAEEISAWEKSQVKHWESNDTVYNVSAKCQ